MLRNFLFLTSLILSTLVNGQTVLINDVRIFNGVDAKLKHGNVLVKDGIIKKISKSEIVVTDEAIVIAGNNRVLSPGFIDLHAHLSLQHPLIQMNADPLVKGVYAGEAARFYLDSGFTTLRGAGGTHPDFAKAIEAGTIYGPRLYASGAIVSQTSGHGDMRKSFEPHPTMEGNNPYLLGGVAIIADGVDQTLMAVRENLKSGATQIKIMGGGGVMSEYDPIHTLQPSPSEIRAAVQAASDWGTYVLAHSYTSEAITRLVKNGVKNIEHGNLIDDRTAKLVKKNNVVINAQVFLFSSAKNIANMSENNKKKLQMVSEGLVNLIRLIKKYDIMTGFSTDLIFGAYTDVGKEFTARSKFWTPAEVLKQATSNAAKIIRMSKLNRHGDFGEIREGWVADLVLINGEPLEDISILEDKETAIALVMKNGVIVKNRL
ncbi:MAG: imidazolonepropionase-like amidohydrolase [Enterobacterales bacterium]|jgi:imidazolonepropionase-like amidohydrolase